MSFEAQTGLLDQVDGSAVYKMNETKVISSVTGPIEVNRIRNELPTRAFLDLNIRPAAGVPSTRENLLQQKLEKLLLPLINLNLYPRQSIQIVSQILNNEENLNFTIIEFTCIINSIFFSLLNSGIALNSSFFAISSSINKSNGEIIIYPTNNDLLNSISNHITVFSFKNGKVDELIFSDSLGEFTESQFLNILEKSANEIQLNYNKITEIIKKSVKDDFIWKF
ncbi:hypothetical protein BVG19_g1462 [[Candida] boidinii]|nr:hypothetical protein BVG19_g1462 [[Candida] boidinii]OWB51039.1 hypothetical protein B5S27_g2596 [[Candida] boidinii]